MSERLTWFELSALKEGAVVAFGCEFHHSVSYQPKLIPVGTVCTIEENGLNEIWSAIIVRPADAELSASLVYAHTDCDGSIHINGPDAGISAYPTTPDEDAEWGATWGALSPFTLHETCPVECI